MSVYVWASSFCSSMATDLHHNIKTFTLYFRPPSQSLLPHFHTGRGLDVKNMLYLHFQRGFVPCVSSVVRRSRTFHPLIFNHLADNRLRVGNGGSRCSNSIRSYCHFIWKQWAIHLVLGWTRPCRAVKGLTFFRSFQIQATSSVYIWKNYTLLVSESMNISVYCLVFH